MPKKAKPTPSIPSDCQCPEDLADILSHSPPGLLAIDLPSGRTLHYMQSRIQPNKYDGESITCEGFTATKNGTVQNPTVPNSLKISSRPLAGTSQSVSGSPPCKNTF